MVDVEVIAFKRNVALTELEEHFLWLTTCQLPRAQADIISDIISPDISYLKQGLAVCGADTSVKWPSTTIERARKDVDFLSLSKDNSSQHLVTCLLTLTMKKRAMDIMKHLV